MDFTDSVFEELHGVHAEVMDAGQHVPGIFLWGFIKAWEIQERYLRNQFRYDPTLTGRLVRLMLVHGGEKYFKAQLAQIDKHEEHIIYLHAMVTDNNKEISFHTRRNETYSRRYGKEETNQNVGWIKM